MLRLSAFPDHGTTRPLGADTGYRYIAILMIYDRIAIDIGIYSRPLLQCITNRFCKETHEAKVYAMLFLELVFVLGS
jgi:hypothetical protein